MTAAAWVLRLYGVGYIGIRQLLAPACCALALALAPLSVRADTVLDWNAVVLDVVRLMRLTPPMASRELAIVNTAAFDAVDAASASASAQHAGASNWRIPMFPTPHSLSTRATAVKHQPAPAATPARRPPSRRSAR